MIRQMVVVPLALAFVVATEARADVSLQSLGPCNVAGVDRYDLVPTGISADGRVIVGVVGGIGTAASPLFRWTAAEGAVALTDGLGGTLTGSCVDVSYDGTTMAGCTSTSSGIRPFIMAAGGTPTILGLPAGATGADTVCISADGSMVGGSFPGTTYGNYVWTSSGGWQESFCYFSDPQQVAENFATSVRYPGYWTQTSGQAYFTPPSQTAYMYGPVMVMSGDGTVIASSGSYDAGMFGGIWRIETDWQGMAGAPSSLEFEQFTPHDISHDGSMVVGITTTGDQAFFWTADGGWVGLQDFLEGQGVDVLSLFPNGLDALTYPRVLISADGSTITGFATRDGAGYAAVIPEPATLGLLGAGLGAMLIRRRGKR